MTNGKFIKIVKGNGDGEEPHLMEGLWVLPPKAIPPWRIVSPMLKEMAIKAPRRQLSFCNNKVVYQLKNVLILSD